VEFSQEVSSEDIRQVLGKFDLERSSIQESDNNQFVIRLPILDDQDSSQVIDALRVQLGSMEVLSNESVGSVVSSELRSKAIIALVIAAVLMLIYITVRFELSFALVAIITQIHDVLITVSIFSLLQLEINMEFIIAILTILAYSINNTIVIFDRIRENISFKEKLTLSELVNKSIKQSLLRSINTSATSIAVLFSLVFFGGETIRLLAIAMIIGFMAGTFSSIFIAGPLWIELKQRWFINDKKRIKS